MEPDKALKMFKDYEEYVQDILKEDSCNVMIERAMELGYDYANCEGDEK